MPQCTERGQIGEQAVAQVGSPLNGGVCFVSSSTDTVYLDSVAPGATVQFSVTPRYTNVDLRLFIDTPPGRTVRVYVTNQAGVAINGSTAAGGMAGGGDLPVAASTAPADNLVFDGPLLCVSSGWRGSFRCGVPTHRAGRVFFFFQV